MMFDEAKPSIVFSSNLSRIREHRNLSLARLAEITGVSRAMLNQIEKGRSIPTIDIAGRIATGLQIEIGALLTARFNDETNNDAEVLPNAIGR